MAWAVSKGFDSHLTSAFPELVARVEALAEQLGAKADISAVEALVLILAAAPLGPWDAIVRAPGKSIHLSILKGSMRRLLHHGVARPRVGDRCAALRLAPHRALTGSSTHGTVARRASLSWMGCSQVRSVPQPCARATPVLLL